MEPCCRRPHTRLKGRRKAALLRGKESLDDCELAHCPPGVTLAVAWRSDHGVGVAVDREAVGLAAWPGGPPPPKDGTAPVHGLAEAALGVAKLLPPAGAPPAGGPWP